MMGVDYVLKMLPDQINPADLEGRTFQIHVLPDNRLRLVLVELHRDIRRCPVIINGERCGEQAGHKGKHMWANGD